MTVLCEMPTIQYSAGSARLYVIGGFFGLPESSTKMASRSVQLFLQGSLGDRPTNRPTDHATRSFAIGGIYVRSTAMWSNNNCSIYRLLDWFPYFIIERKKASVDSRLHLARGVELHAELYTSLTEVQLMLN